MVIVSYAKEIKSWPRFYDLLHAIIGDDSILISPHISPKRFGLQFMKGPLPHNLGQMQIDTVNDFDQVALARLTGKELVNKKQYESILQLSEFFDQVQDLDGNWLPINPKTPARDAPEIIENPSPKKENQGEASDKSKGEVSGKGIPSVGDNSPGVQRAPDNREKMARIWEDGDRLIIIEGIDLVSGRLLGKIDGQKFQIDMKKFQLKNALEMTAFLHFHRDKKGHPRPSAEARVWRKALKFIFTSLAIQGELNF